MSKIKQLVWYVPAAILAFVFASFSVGGLLQESEYIGLVGSLGFSATVTSALVYLVFPLDGAVATFILFGNKISARFPWCFLYIWAGAWPWIPRYLEYRSGLESEVGEAVFLSVVAVVAYKIQKKKGIGFFAKPTEVMTGTTQMPTPPPRQPMM